MLSVEIIFKTNLNGFFAETTTCEDFTPLGYVVL